MHDDPICMCSLVLQDGTCNTIPRALYKCQEVFGVLLSVNFQARCQYFEQISCQCFVSKIQCTLEVDHNKPVASYISCTDSSFYTFYKSF